MVIIVQEPDILVYHHVGHNIDDLFAFAVYKGTTARLGLGHLPCSLARGISRMTQRCFNTIFSEVICSRLHLDMVTIKPTIKTAPPSRNFHETFL